jgi:hypothetical protein
LMVSEFGRPRPPSPIVRSDRVGCGGGRFRGARSWSRRGGARFGSNDCGRFPRSCTMRPDVGTHSKADTDGPHPITTKPPHASKGRTLSNHAPVRERVPSAMQITRTKRRPPFHHRHSTPNPRIRIPCPTAFHTGRRGGLGRRSHSAPCPLCGRGGHRADSAQPWRQCRSSRCAGRSRGQPPAYCQITVGYGPSVVQS